MEAADASASASASEQSNNSTASAPEAASEPTNLTSDVSTESTDSTTPVSSNATELNPLDSNQAQPSDSTSEERYPTTTEEPITPESLQQLWHPQLQEWATKGELLTAASTALHLDANQPPAQLAGVVERLSQGLTSDIPPIELLQQAAMASAAGAYAASEQTIFLNRDWLNAASETDTIKVLTEEFGHHLDALIHTTDTPGDEGRYFADLLTKDGKYNEDSHYLELKDQGQIIVQNKQLNVEFSQQNASLEWIQIGDEITGAERATKTGHAVSLSQDGTILAVGSPYDDLNSGDTTTNKGSVTVYQDLNGTWQALGSKIEGTVDGDQLGYSVSLSNDGTRLAIATKFANTTNGSNTGRVNVYSFTDGDWSELQSGGIAGPHETGRIENVALSGDGNYVILGSPNYHSGYAEVYQYNNNQWEQVGLTLSGATRADRFGYAVDISDDGSIIAVGSYAFDVTGARNAGAVNIYELTDNQWNELVEITGEKLTDNFGYSVALSSDGTYLAAGARHHDIGGNKSSDEGYARVYKRNGSSYSQIGQTLVGDQAGQEVGTKVSISDDGLRIAIGSGEYDLNGNNNVGQAKLYELQSETWTQIGSDINGQNQGDLLARWHGLSLSGDGTRVAVGAHNNDNTANNAGQVRIFDSSGITIAQGSTPLVTSETGTTASFTVVLDAQPTDTVTVAISGDDSTEHDLSASTLTFTTANWDTPQTITVTGIDDSLDDGDITTTLTATASNTGGYAGTETATATLQTTDDDTAGITIAQGSTPLVTSETGTTASFTVVLDAQPTDTVTVAISDDDSTEHDLSASTLTFTTANWDTPQTITITGVDDNIIDGDIITTLTATASNTGSYAGTESASVTVKNTDDDNPPALANQDIYVLESVADGTELIDLEDSNTTNDNDQDGDPISYSIQDGNDAGLFTIDSTTGKIYLATNQTLDYTTSDRHTLEITAASTGGTSTAEVNIYVESVNNAPVAENDTAALNENETLSATEAEGLITNDSDDDEDDSLSISNFHAGFSDTDSPRIGQFNTALDGLYGQLTLQTNGAYTYTANKTSADALNTGEIGTDTFSYTLSDSEDTDQAELTISITGINDNPFLVDAIKTKKYIEGQGNIIVIDGSLDIRDVDDANIESATVSISNSTYVNTEDQLAFNDAYGITGNWNSNTGVLTLSGTTTKANYVSALQTVTYTNTNNADPLIGTRTIEWLVNDGDSNSTSIQSSIIVGGRNDAPLAVNNSASVDGGSTVSTSTEDNLLDNDSDPESHSLSIKSFRLGSEQSSNPDFLAGNTLTGSYGQMTINSDGTYSYSAQESAAYKLLDGETATETFTYTITDSQTVDEGIDTGEITFTIDGKNDSPTAIDDSVEVDEDSSKQFADFLGILKNDTDVDGDQLFIKGVTAGVTTSNVRARSLESLRLQSSNLSTELQGTYGILIVNSNGSFRYTASLADALDAGDKEVDRFTYTLTDLTNDDSGVIEIEVTGINDTPILSSITAGSISDQANSSSLQTSNITGQLSATDADASAVLTYGISGTSGSTASGTYGTLTLNSTTGAYQYSPESTVIEALNSGESVSDSFEIYVSDGSQSTTKTFQINITGANDASNAGSNNSDASSTTSNDAAEDQPYGLTIVASGVINRAGQLITNEEGSSSSFTVALNRQPSADVDVLISGLDSTEGRLDKDILRFTPSNWNVAQTVTVTGINDRFTDGNATYNLTATANEAGGYSGKEAATITINNADLSNPQPSQLVVNRDDKGFQTTGDTGLWIQLEVLQANADLHNSLQIINDEGKAIGSIGATRNSTNMGKQEFFLSGGSEWFFHQLSHDSKLDESPSLRIDSEIDDFILHLDDSKDGDNDHDDLSIKITTSQQAKNLEAAKLASEQANIYDSILNLSEINAPTTRLRITIQSDCADVNKIGLVKITSDEKLGFTVNGIASTAGESFDQAIRDNLINPGGSELLINGLSRRQVEWNLDQGEEGFYAPVFINQNTNDLFTFGATSAADNQIHVKNLGSNFFGYEDTLSSLDSDWDFNDITMLVEMI